MSAFVKPTAILFLLTMVSGLSVGSSSLAQEGFGQRFRNIFKSNATVSKQETNSSPSSHPDWVQPEPFTLKSTRSAEDRNSVSSVRNPQSDGTRSQKMTLQDPPRRWTDPASPPSTEERFLTASTSKSLRETPSIRPSRLSDESSERSFDESKPAIPQEERINLPNLISSERRFPSGSDVAPQKNNRLPNYPDVELAMISDHQTSLPEGTGSMGEGTKDGENSDSASFKVEETIPTLSGVETTGSATGPEPEFPRDAVLPEDIPLDSIPSSSEEAFDSSREEREQTVKRIVTSISENPISGDPDDHSPGETLETAWRIASEMSRVIAARQDQRQSADANIRAAVGVGLPKISNISGRHTVSEELKIETDVPLSQLIPTLPDVNLETPVADKDFTTSITSLTIPIYMGGKVRGMIEVAQAAANAIASGEEIDQQTLKNDVAETYFLVLRVRRLYAVALEAERTFASHEEDARRLFDQGIVTKNVVLAAQVAHANAEQDVIRAGNAVSLSEAAYNRLLWRPLDSPVKLVDMEIPPASGDLETLTAGAISRRPELAALAYKSQAIAAQAKVHRADRLPQVAAVGSHNYFENSHLNTNSTFSGSIGVAWMPFDGGVSRNRQEASTFEAMSVTREHEDAESKIRLQVYQCWLEEKESRTRVGVAQEAVEQADENLRMVVESFKQGIANHSEVLDAQTLRTQAWSNLANARYDAILATYHLRKAVGTL